MKRILAIALVAGLAACSVQPVPLDKSTDNVPAEPNWERIARASDASGVYKVVDLEDGVICYYVVLHQQAGGLSCMPFFSGQEQK